MLNVAVFRKSRVTGPGLEFGFAISVRFTKM